MDLVYDYGELVRSCVQYPIDKVRSTLDPDGFVLGDLDFSLPDIVEAAHDRIKKIGEMSREELYENSGCGTDYFRKWRIWIYQNGVDEIIN